VNILELVKRAQPSPEPVFAGEWGTLLFRPDLGSRQEYIVGIAAAIDGDRKIHVAWLPSLTKLCALYGEAISSSEVSGLLRGSELSIHNSNQSDLNRTDSGTPHIRLAPCGYVATHDVEAELQTLLKRHAGAIWYEPPARELRNDDDWAYSTMLHALADVQMTRNIFVPARSLSIAGKRLNIGLDNSVAYGNIVSARYSNFSTVASHIFASMRHVALAHKLAQRSAQPVLFVVLPEIESSVDAMMSRKSADLLSEVEEMGVLQFCEPDPARLAKKIEEWAAA
jgi:hypothetical protein